jgi:hypothetical protein
MTTLPDNRENAHDGDLFASSPSTHHAGDAADATGTCHMMPCNIDYTGMAPTHVYFKPVPVENGIYASSFRGRGLLATIQNTSRSSSSSTSRGVGGEIAVPLALLSVEENRQVRVKESIDNVLEWHHEHSVEALRFRDAPSRLQVAKEWSQVARSVSIYATGRMCPVQ